MSVIRQGLESADLDVPVVLPTLNLDFANSQSLDKRITFTRSSTATRVNRNGLIETVGVNQPRFDFDPISGECKGLLIEEQRTNLVTNSTTLSFQSINNLTDGTLNPDGSAAIARIPNSSGIYHATSGSLITPINLNAIGIAVGATYNVTFSCWVKDYNGSDMGAYFVTAAYLAGSPNTNQTYQLANAKPKSATWTNSSIGAGWARNYQSIIPYPNGWYRFVQSSRYTRQSNQDTLDFYFQIWNNRNAQFYRGDNSSGIYMWGPQVEAGAFETSYVPTSGSTATRSADNASMTGTNFSSWYNQTEGTIIAKSFIPTNSMYSGTFRSLVQFIKSSTYNSDSIFLMINAVVSSAIEVKSSSLRFVSFNQSTYSSGNISAISYKEKYYTLSTKGLFPTSSLSGALPSGIDKMIIGNVGDNNPLGCANGTISRLTYYPKALSPAELQYLTQ